MNGTIRVLAPGLLTTVQDLGRPGHAHVGVSPAGAADTVSLRIGNRLTGNPEGAAALEMTLQGGRFEFTHDSIISLTGGAFDCSVPMWRTVRVRAGETVEVKGAASGARCYLCVRGGIESERILGSASVHLLSGFGRPLRKGDELAIGAEPAIAAASRAVTPPEWRKRIRITSGAQTARFTSEAFYRLVSSAYLVSGDSNRQGLRLTGTAGVVIPAPDHGQMASEGVALGAVQVPQSGEPILLFVDSQTTGGYPVIASVITADLASLGQLRPRDAVRFEAVSFAEAKRLLLEQEEFIHAAC